MKLQFPKLFLTIILFLVYNNVLYSQSNPNKIFDEYLAQYLENKNVPSISAGLLENGEIIWNSSIGKSDIENNVPVSTASLYRIASISKPITAVAILQLWERGLLNLDTDVITYLPNFPVKKYKFTIRQLLNHTAGIRNYREGEFDSKKFYATTDDALKILAYDSLIFEPGTKYAYTSLGYNLLSAIIEKVSKTSYEDYIKTNIFIPAGMQSSKVDKQSEIITNRTRGYEKNAFRRIVNAPLADLSIKVAGGGLLSTTKDLLLFSKALMEYKLLKQSTLDMMLRRSKLKSGKEINYGLGFSLEFVNDSLKYIAHNGAGTGFSSMLLIDPTQKIASVHLINARDRNLGEPAKDILNMFTTGVPQIPAKTLSDELMRTYLTFGIDSTNIRLNYIYTNEQAIFTLNEDEAIFFLDDLIELKKISDAITYLKDVVKLYPKSFKVIVATADAYVKDNNSGLALRYYRLAAQIDNTNSRVNNLIKKLSIK
jgi:CubicO group peptidase (beta-lactamase class C family)